MSVSSRTATVGQPAPDFSLATSTVREFHLAEAVSSGPVVVVFLRGFRLTVLPTAPLAVAG